MDFAIIETGGKQYKITPGSTVEVEKIDGKAGDTITLDKVLMVVEGKDIKIGTPYLNDVSLEAEIKNQHKGKKIQILRFKAKSRYRRRQGHRQLLTTLSLSDKTKKAKTETKTKEEKRTAKAKVKTEAKVVTKKTAAKPKVKSPAGTTKTKKATAKVK